MDLELTGRVALVTGASRGLGEQIALGLALEGATVVATARSLDDLERVAAAGDGRILPLQADLANGDEAAGVVDRAVALAGGLDVLVNNAGIAPAGDFLTQDPSVWQRTLAINVIAPMLLCQAAGRHFAGQGHGKIVNVASTVGLRGKPVLVGYAASKGAMLRMTESLAAEWARHNIQVNAIAPGAFATEAQQAVLADAELLRRRVRRIPAQRMGEAEEIRGLACLLASGRSDFITGSVFVIDGGESGKL